MKNALVRRRMKLDGMVYATMNDKTKCRMWLAVTGDEQFKRVTEDLRTLEHVLSATSNKDGLGAVHFLLRRRR